MNLEENKYYKIKINLFGREETYEGKVLSKNKYEFRFETNENCSCRALTLKIKDIIFIKEISKPEKKEVIFKISNKKKFTDLKKSDEPDF